MTNKFLATLILATATQANSAALTVSEYFMLYQQNKTMAAAYTAGVIDASRDAFWCHKKDPSIEQTMKNAIQTIVELQLDPDQSADYAIVPSLQKFAPCQNQKPNT